MMKTSTTTFSENIALDKKRGSPVVVATSPIKGQEPMWHEQYKNQFDSNNQEGSGG